MALSKKEKQQVGQLISFFLISVLLLFIVSKLNEFRFDALETIIGHEAAKRISEATSITVPSLLIDGYGLSLPVLILIVIYLVLKNVPPKKRGRF